MTFLRANQIEVDDDAMTSGGCYTYCVLVVGRLPATGISTNPRAYEHLVLNSQSAPVVDSVLPSE
jgi:hypothetical protein